MKNRFYVNLKCKTYVKQYLYNFCGDPVDLKNLPHLRDSFVQCLRKPDTRRDTSYGDDIRNYNESIEVIISEDEFYRFGWELSKSDTIAFGNEVEEQAKSMMRIFIATYTSFGIQLKTAITMFQEKFNFPEEVWSYESIKKDFYRNGQSQDIFHQFSQQIDKIILDNLSLRGTTLKNLKKQYELNKETSK